MNRNWRRYSTKQKVFKACKFLFWLMVFLLFNVGIAVIWGAAGITVERIAGTLVVIAVFSVCGLIATEEL